LLKIAGVEKETESLTAWRIPRYAKLAKTHLAKTGNTAREMWKLMEGEMRSKTETGS